jgi:hypothetical protein
MFYKQIFAFQRRQGACTAATTRVCDPNEQVNSKLLKIGPNINMEPDRSKVKTVLFYQLEVVRACLAKEKQLNVIQFYLM